MGGFPQQPILVPGNRQLGKPCIPGGQNLHNVAALSPDHRKALFLENFLEKEEGILRGDLEIGRGGDGHLPPEVLLLVHENGVGFVGDDLDELLEDQRLGQVDRDFFLFGCPAFDRLKETAGQHETTAEQPRP